MKASKSRYSAVEEFVAFALATLLREPRQWHPLSELSHHVTGGTVSRSYAEQIFKNLRRAGLPIEAKRGPGGGYRAGEELGRVTFLAVLQALDLAPDKPSSEWARLRNESNGVYVLADLIDT